jgi:beta-glucosidase
MRRPERLVLALISFFLPIISAVASSAEPQGDIERRADLLVRQMTVEEKAGQLTQLSGLSPNTLDQIRQGKVGSLLGVLGAEDTNRAQRAALEQSRLKIPLLLGYDVIHGYRTIFPLPLASAASFDLQLIEQAERVAAREASAAGLKWTFAPMLDIARDPRWGRIAEGAGEDPYLGSEVAAARVRGFQGPDLADPGSVVACAKHYAAYGAVEGGRDYNTVDISEELLREIYLPPFHAAVKAGVRTLMSAFNDLNGIPASANRHTLTEILRGEWKFKGFVVSDYDAVHELIPHGTAADDSQATLEALTAGVDMDMADGDYARYLPALVERGKLPMGVLDEAVRRVLRVKIEAGLFAHPYRDPSLERTAMLTPESLQLARRLAQESMVLLKNENDRLPLGTHQTLAVIGPLADDKASQLGSWAGHGQAQDAVTPLEAIIQRIGKEHVHYAKGVDIPPYESALGAGVAAPAPSTATGVISSEAAHGPATIAEAVKAAESSDQVILFLGELAGMTGEASSRASLDLPGEQIELVHRVLETHKPVVVVLESGRPLDIRWAVDGVPAIIQAWYLGVEAGHAIADVIFGEVSPSGRLPLSWPRSVGQIPVYYNHKNTGRPSSPDRWHTGYLDLSREPLFPFGYGLSYTSFHYSDLRSDARPAADGKIGVSAEIENRGTRAGTEVAQLYVHDPATSTSRPVRELKGFERITLQPGERRRVEFRLEPNELGSYDAQMHWVVPHGVYDVWIAPDATGGIHGTFTVD